MPEDDEEPKEAPAGAGDATPPSGPSTDSLPPGAPGGRTPPGAPTLPPSAAPMGMPVQAAGAQAVVRNQLRLMVDALHQKFSPLFEYNSREGKAIHKALSALAPVFGAPTGREQTDRTGAMAALMARAATNRASQPPPGAGPPGGAMPGPPGGGPPGLPRGPIPAMGGGGM